MGHDRLASIEAYFAEHDDGEFAVRSRDFPYSVVPPHSDSACIIITTKPHLVAREIEVGIGRSPFGMIGRCGLPDPSDVDWIREAIGSRRAMFLGDLDPVDLMIFAWLRAKLRPTPIAHLGVNDAYLALLQLNVTPSICIPCAPSEQDAMPLLCTILPDLRETIGPECEGLLRQGKKIELEAIVSAKPGASILPRLT